MHDRRGVAVTFWGFRHRLVGFEIERLRLKKRWDVTTDGGGVLLVGLLRPNTKMEVPTQNNWYQKIFGHSGKKRGQNAGRCSEIIKN